MEFPLTGRSLGGRAANRLVGGLAAGAMLIASCRSTSGQEAEVACDQLELGRPEAAVMILSDGSRQSLEDTLRRVAERPELLFGSPKLGLDSQTGLVIVATYDASGRVDPVGHFDLEGVGGDRVRQDLDAERQADCLGEVSAEIPDVSAGGPNLLRSLSAADDILLATGAERTALVIHGFSQSDNDGFIPVEADLSPEQRPNVLSLLIDEELIPNVSHAVQFVSPGEGAATGIQEQHITAFVDDYLCPTMTSHPCESTSVVS